MASQKRGGSNQKIAPPIVEDGTVRRVLQNTENLFNQELVDRVFEDASIPTDKFQTSPVTISYPQAPPTSDAYAPTVFSQTWTAGQNDRRTVDLTSYPSSKAARVYIEVVHSTTDANKAILTSPAAGISGLVRLALNLPNTLTTGFFIEPLVNNTFTILPQIGVTNNTTVTVLLLGLEN